MQRDQHDYRVEETYVARPGETHIVRGETHIVNERSPREVDENASPEEIRAEIEVTRAELSQTIDAIQEKLSPETLKEQALEVVREASEQAKEVVREVSDNAGRAVHEATIGRAEQFFSDVDESIGGMGSTIMDTIKQNPIPAALIGLGLGWMFFNGRSRTERRRSRRPYFDTHYDSYPDAAGRDRSRGRWSGYGPTRYTDYPSEVEPGYGNYRVSPRTHERADAANGESFTNRAGEAVGDLAGRAGETVGDVAGRAGETVGEFANRAGETMGDFADQARWKARQAQGTFQQQILENPLAVGAIALGLGAAAGLAAPRTSAEDRLMGEAREKLMGQAHGFVREAGDKVQQFVDQAGQQIQEKAEDATWQAGEKVQDSLSKAAGAAGQAVTQAGSAMRQAGSAMREAGSSVQQTGATVQREAHGSTGASSLGSGSSSSPGGSTSLSGTTGMGSSATGTSTTSGGSIDPSSSIGGSPDPLSR